MSLPLDPACLIQILMGQLEGVTEDEWRDLIEDIYTNSRAPAHPGHPPPATLDDRQDVTLDEGRGRNALHVACATGHANMVAALLEYGADVTLTDNNGWTPLHWAVHGPESDLRLTTDMESMKRTVDVLLDHVRAPARDAFESDAEFVEAAAAWNVEPEETLFKARTSAPLDRFDDDTSASLAAMMIKRGADAERRAVEAAASVGKERTAEAIEDHVNDRMNRLLREQRAGFAGMESRLDDIDESIRAQARQAANQFKALRDMHVFGDVPRVVLTFPPDDWSDRDAGPSGASESKAPGGGGPAAFWEAVKGRPKELARRAGLVKSFRLVLCCEGHQHCHRDVDVSCSPPHEGYTIDEAGDIVRKAAPVLRVAAQLVKVAGVAGKLCGLPLPTSIPGLSLPDATEFGELFPPEMCEQLAAFNEAIGQSGEDDGEGAGAGGDEEDGEDGGIAAAVESADERVSAAVDRADETEADMAAVGSGGVAGADVAAPKVVGDAYSTLVKMLASKTDFDKNRAFLHKMQILPDGDRVGGVAWMCSKHANVVKELGIAEEVPVTRLAIVAEKLGVATEKPPPQAAAAKAAAPAPDVRPGLAAAATARVAAPSDVAVAVATSESGGGNGGGDNGGGGSGVSAASAGGSATKSCCVVM